MQTTKLSVNRRIVLSGAGASLLSMAFAKPALAAGFADILAMASDNALDKLAKPGAFYGDKDIRIGLPLVGRLGELGDLTTRVSGLLGGKSKADLFGNLTRKINDAAGTAAGEAKPIFRESIGQLSITDAPEIISQENGGTRYLKESSGETLLGKLRPLVDTAMGDLGAYEELDSLGNKSDLVKQAGLTSDKLGASVTKQTLDGIFSYLANEEKKFRANPLDKVGGILKDILN